MLLLLPRDRGRGGVEGRERGARQTAIAVCNAMKCILIPPPGSQFDPATWLHGIHQASNAKGYVFTENVSWAWSCVLKKSYPCSHVHGHDFFKNPAKFQDTISKAYPLELGAAPHRKDTIHVLLNCSIGKRILSVWRCYLVLFIISIKHETTKNPCQSVCFYFFLREKLFFFF